MLSGKVKHARYVKLTNLVNANQEALRYYIQQVLVQDIM